MKIIAKTYFHLICTGKSSCDYNSKTRLGHVTSPESKMAERAANVSHCTDFVSFHLYSLLYWSLFSLSLNWRLLFRGDVARVASISVGFPRKFRCFGLPKIKARPKKQIGGRGRGEKVSFSPLPLPPLSFFWLSPHQTSKFATETLATQARGDDEENRGREQGTIGTTCCQ